MALDRGVFIAFRGYEKTHLAAGGDVFLSDVTEHLPVLDQRRGADRTVGCEEREADDGSDAVAAGGDFHKGVFAQFEEGRFAQQVECGGTADGLFCENHEVGMSRLGFLDGTDDLRGIAVDVADRVV